METMTARERMMIALRNGEPDRVPVAPDFSCMVPCRLTGRPFWDILMDKNPPLWKAYINAVKYFGIDGWFIYGDIHYRTNSAVESTTERHFDESKRRWQVRTVHKTPDGELTSCTVYPEYAPQAITEHVVKDFRNDFKKLLHLFPDITGYDDSYFRQQVKELGELGIMGLSCAPAGFPVLFNYFERSLEALTFAYYDHPDLFEELCTVYDDRIMKQLEIILEVKPDSVLTGGSGSITLQSPEIWREMSLPTLKKITRMCREAGVICGVHSCGKQRYMVQACAEETDLDYINPLEIPPMGDCDLKECKDLWGQRLALMGNLHTTEVMLRGTSEDVRRESLKAILSAGKGGGFVLSTGDQCGRDTPDENLFEMVATAKEFGAYPLDLDRITQELHNFGSFKSVGARQAGD